MAESGDNNKSHNKFDVVSRGLLDEITKPASAPRSRPGSKVSQFGKVDRQRPRDVTPGNLEFLTPEEIMRQDFDLEIHDYGSGDSEYTDEEDSGSNFNTGRTSEMFGVAEPLTDRQARQQQRAALAQQEEESEYLLSRQLTLMGSLGESDDEDVDSDEEKSIVRDIKAEIKNQVKEEMKQELAVYQHKREQLNKPEQKKDDTDTLDPKIKEALLKMRKLDRILAKKIKKEKQVKKDRILLQRKLKVELENIKPEGGRREMKEEKVNTEKFLALTLPPSHNAGVLVPAFGEEEEPPCTPVFPTQVLEETIERERVRQANRQANHEGESESLAAGSTSRTDAASATSSRDSRDSSASHKSKRDKDFIKRNIQLAADAGNAIAMTDDEKKRVEDLLGDLDTLPEIPEDEESDIASTTNPYQIAVSYGDGFYPSQEEMSHLHRIDSRLKELLPPEDYESIATTSRTGVSTPSSQVRATPAHIRCMLNQALPHWL